MLYSRKVKYCFISLRWGRLLTVNKGLLITLFFFTFFINNSVFITFFLSQNVNDKHFPNIQSENQSTIQSWNMIVD